VSARATVLVADDDPAIRDLVSIYLRGEGYRVVAAGDGAAAVEAARAGVDLVVLDVMMGGLDGIEACVRIRRERATPIIFLSARAEGLDKIRGLTAGADDYVTKPFDPLELVARVKSQLRRYFELGARPGPPPDDVLAVDDLAVHVAAREVRVGGRPVALTPKEFGIVELLARRPGVVFGVDQIYERVWGERAENSANTVMVHIRKIREKIEAAPRRPRYLKTVWGVGYRLGGG
jgi:DNA-binding response OmpR family regulator